MRLLDRRNWWIVLLLNLITLGLFTFYIGKLLRVYKKDAWYANKYYWILGIIFMIPFMIMFLVFYIQTVTAVSKQLGLFGYQIYSLPYPWILGVIVPIIGWAVFGVLYIYVSLFYAFRLAKGAGEDYLKK